MPLPKPKHRLGYDDKEIRRICKERKVTYNKFWEAFGVNTVAVAEDGKCRYYPCDVEKALFQLGKKDGVDLPWD